VSQERHEVAPEQDLVVRGTLEESRRQVAGKGCPEKRRDTRIQSKTEEAEAE
jgi:hypothetical protein